MKIVQYIIYTSLLLYTISVAAQTKDDSVGQEVVTIVKAYTPTLSDAFKVKETPVMEDPETNQKENINYTINSFPVASTFTPSKGKAAAVEKPKPEQRFQNYATLQLGNYTTIGAEAGLSYDISSTDYILAVIKHLSSNSDIKNTLLPSKYAQSGLKATYGSRNNSLNWNVDLGAQNNTYHWYGLPIDDNITITPEIIDQMQPKHSYNTLETGGNLTFKDSSIDQVNLLIRYFDDSFESSEIQASFTPMAKLNIVEQEVTVKLITDYLSGKFSDVNTYKTGIVGLVVGIPYQYNGFSFHLGGKVYYSTTNLSDTKENNFNIYPNITTSYRINGDNFIAFGGLSGNLIQNTYHAFANQNPFIYNDQLIVPTNQPINLYGGIKGKIVPTVAFTAQASLNREKNKALYQKNDTNLFSPNYIYGNTFNILYDKVTTLAFSADVTADFTKNVTFTLGGNIYNYTTDAQAEPWNLPNFNVNSTLSVSIAEKWLAQAQLFYIGTRKDLLSYWTTSPLDPAFLNMESKVITLDGYADVNLMLSYKYNPRLTAFVKGQNLTNNSYQQWLHYPVQGIQILGGATYKFDF